MPTTPHLSGDDLENFGRTVFDDMELTCIGQLANASLRDLDPSGSYSSNEHLEFDYLIPLGDLCLVGEITSRNSDKAPEKYRKHRRHLQAIQQALSKSINAAARGRFWTALGVPGPELRHFRNVRQLRSFAIFTEFERAEVDFEAVSDVSVFYRYEWSVLQEYAASLGTVGQYALFDTLDIQPPSPEHVATMLKYSQNSGQLLPVPNRYVTSDTRHLSHVLTFVASPFDLLPLSKVWRRDAMPRVDGNLRQRYQRTLLPEKLKSIRATLLTDPDFMFPNSIFAVLSSECKYKQSSGTLAIPHKYGALNIVDGQHRLFAYADSSLQATAASTARILVTAVCFDGANEDEVRKISARSFIEINTNQTRVSSKHLFGIAYEILGRTDHRALAAHILRIVNERKNSLRGRLNTADSPAGRIKIMEVVGSLGAITNTSKMASIAASTSGIAKRRQRALAALFNATASELSNADTLVSKGIVCVERYFNSIAKTFAHDWPQVSGPSNGSAFELTKFIAAFIRLFRKFIDEGADWAIVERDLNAILENVKTKRKRKQYRRVLFETTGRQIPDATVRISDMFRFLERNRHRPTSIAQVLRTR